MFKLLTIGDNNIDIYRQSGIAYPGGNCSNVAAYAALNGYDSAYIGVVGNDDMGTIMQRGLESAGVDISHMITKPGSSSVACISVEDGDRLFSDYDRSIIDNNPIQFDNDDLDFIKGFDLIHSSIYSEFAEGEFSRLASLGIPIVYDFSVEWHESYNERSDEEYLNELRPKSSDFLQRTCAKIDYAFLSCSHISEQESLEIIKQCVHWGCKTAVGTRRLNGAYAFDGHEVYHQNAYKTDIVDTLGAGDSFLTRFILTYFEGIQILEHCNHLFPTCKYEHEDIMDYYIKLMQSALSQAALFASFSCQTEGAFGFGEKVIRPVDGNWKLT